MSVLGIVTLTDIMIQERSVFRSEAIDLDEYGCEVEVRLLKGPADQRAMRLVPRAIADAAGRLRARGVRVVVGPWEQWARGKRYPVSWTGADPLPHGRWPRGWPDVADGVAPPEPGYHHPS